MPVAGCRSHVLPLVIIRCLTLLATIEAIETSKAPAPVGPYSQAIKVTGGTTVYVSGCIALNNEGKMVGGGDVVEETKQVLANAKEVLI